MTPPVEQRRRYTVEEYLRLEEESEERHDYWDGYIVPLSQLINMAGGTYEHSLITTNLSAALVSKLKPRTTLLNPRIVVEVLSPSTELYDRAKKLLKYFQITSLQEYVLVAQTEPRIDTYFRHPDGSWAFSIAIGIEGLLTPRSLGVSIPLKEIYAGITFPPQSELTPESR
jgi:Uma2 family endonuclease